MQAHARALREEQDAAFRESLAADREREARRQQAQEEKQQQAAAAAASAAAAKCGAGLRLKGSELCVVDMVFFEAGFE